MRAGGNAISVDTVGSSEAVELPKPVCAAVSHDVSASAAVPNFASRSLTSAAGAGGADSNVSTLCAASNHTKQ